MRPRQVLEKSVEQVCSDKLLSRAGVIHLDSLPISAGCVVVCYLFNPPPLFEQPVNCLFKPDHTEGGQAGIKDAPKAEGG